MITNINEPNFTKACDILEFLFEEFGCCGCSDTGAIIDILKELLIWHDSDIEKRPRFSTLFGGNEGIYYLLAGAFDRARLNEHGSSIRSPWLTEKGKQFLAGLRQFTSQEIENAVGEAYDGALVG